MAIEESLQQIGLTVKEARMYVYLLQNGPSNPTQIAHATGIKRPNVYEYLKSLEKQGLVYYQLINKKKLPAASNPEEIAEIMKQKLDIAKSILPHLKSIDTQSGFKSNIKFYQGRRAMQQLFTQTLSMKKKEFWGLWPALDMNKNLGKKFMDDFIAKRVKKGIMLKSLRDASKESFYDMEVKDEKGKRLTQAAYIPDTYTFSLAMQIYDDTVMFHSSKKENYGFVVESREFAQVMRMLYDIAWQNSGKLKQD